METLNLTIEGMSCGHCVSAVSGALAKVPGVEVKTVALGTAAVSYDPTQASEEQILDAVADEGYSAFKAE
jgi:copper chaperone